MTKCKKWGWTSAWVSFVFLNMVAAHAGSPGEELAGKSLSCPSPYAETFDTGLGFLMIVPKGFEKSDIDGYDKIKRAMTETDALGGAYRYAETTIWSTTLGDGELEEWDVKSVVHELGTNFVFRSYEVPVENGNNLYLLVIVQDDKALMVQSHRQLPFSELLPCLLL